MTGALLNLSRLLYKPWIFLGAAICAFAAPTFEEINAWKQHVLTTVPKMHGWCSQEKTGKLMDLVLKEKPKVCVELGAFGGASILPVATALRLLENGVIYCVDPWDRLEAVRYFNPLKDKVNIEYWLQTDFGDVYKRFLHIINTWQLNKYCVILQKTSADAAEDIKGPIDFLHIDGNHSEIISLLDVQTYLPKVRRGGYICYNDCFWPERIAAMDLLLESCEFIQFTDQDNCIFLRKL